MARYGVYIVEVRGRTVAHAYNVGEARCLADKHGPDAVILGEQREGRVTVVKRGKCRAKDHARKA